MQLGNTETPGFGLLGLRWRVNKWSRKDREGVNTDAPAHRRLNLGQKEAKPNADSHEESIRVLDSCYEPELAQGASPDPDEMQARVQALMSS